MWFALDAAFEGAAFLDDQGLQAVGGDRREIIGPFVEASELAAIADRPAHLPGEFRHDFEAISFRRPTPFSTSSTRSSSGRRDHAFCACRARATFDLAASKLMASRSANTCPFTGGDTLDHCHLWSLVWFFHLLL